MFKLLLVDDSKLVHAHINNLIDDNDLQNIEVQSAYNGDQAIAFTKETMYDLVLLDIVMPEKDGIETLKELRKSNRRLNVIMVSSMGTKEKVASALKYGAQGFMQKPIDEDDLLVTINKYQNKLGLNYDN